MCWIEILRNVKYQVADKDIEVYKIVTLANKQSCVSIIKTLIILQIYYIKYQLLNVMR